MDNNKIKQYFEGCKNIVHANGAFWKCLLLFIASFLAYSSAYAFLTSIIYMGNPWYYYTALYALQVGAIYIFVLILQYFLQIKRDVASTTKRATMFFVSWAVQSILFVVMIACSYVTMQSIQNQVLYALGSMLCMLFMLLYLPLQAFCLFYVIDGKKNPFRIIKDGFVLIIKKYQVCFYALLAVAIIPLLYQFLNSVLFAETMNTPAFMLVHDIIACEQPFVDFISNFVFVFSDITILPQVFLSFVYGAVMCMVLVYFYMILAQVYDEQ